MSEETQAVQPRKVTLWSTKNGKKAVITSTATIWGDLKKEISKAGTFEVDGMLATESVRRSDLASSEAVLPDTDFVIFFRPKEVKSGALDRKGLFAAIKEAIAINPALKAEFTVDGKNMTQLKTDHLQELYTKHIAGGVASAPAKKVAPPKPAPPKPVAKAEPVKKPESTAPQSSQANVADLVVLTGEELKGQISDMSGIKQVVDDLLTRVVNPAVNSNLQGMSASLDTNIEILTGDLPDETEANRQAEEARLEAERIAEEEAAENARLEAEAEALMKSFKK